MATVTVTPGWAGPLSAVSSDPIVIQVAGVGPQGASGVAPSGTGIVTVTSGVLGTPGPLTGDVTTTAGGLATTLATVNSNVGSFTNASVTVNAKGQVTAASSGAGGGTWGSITGTLSSQTDLQNALDAKQAADADLTSWASVTRASGFDTFAATPSSANLAALLTGETGSGAAVFGTAPTISAPVLTGTVVVRQTGGTGGVDEMTFSHDGSEAVRRSYDGPLVDTSATGVHSFRRADAPTFDVVNIFSLAGGGDGMCVGYTGAIGIVSGAPTATALTTSALAFFFSNTFQVNSTGHFGFTSGSSANTGLDVTVKRGAARVLIATDGSSGTGWFQNSAGRSRVTSDVTNTGTTLAAITGLSVTVIAGRKYAGRMVLWMEGSVTAAEGFQLDFNGGSATWTSFKSAIVSNVQGATLVATTAKNISGLLYGTAFSTIDSAHGIVIEWAGVCNAAGTLVPRIAKNTTGGGSTLTVSTNSNMSVEDYP